MGISSGVRVVCALAIPARCCGCFSSMLSCLVVQLFFLPTHTGYSMVGCSLLSPFSTTHGTKCKLELVAKKTYGVAMGTSARGPGVGGSLFYFYFFVLRKI